MTGRLGRLFNKIKDADYSLVYQPGATNYTADMLSRPEAVEANVVEMEFGSVVNWRAEQAADEVLKELTELVRMNEELESNLSCHLDQWSHLDDGDKWYRIREQLVLVDDVLFIEDDGRRKVVVPKRLVNLVLNFHHDMSLAGHRDFEKTIDAIKKRYFWIELSKDVKYYCSTCHFCQTRKHLGKANRAPLKPIIVNKPWELIPKQLKFKKIVNKN